MRPLPRSKRRRAVRRYIESCFRCGIDAAMTAETPHDRDNDRAHAAIVGTIGRLDVEYHKIEGPILEVLGRRHVRMIVGIPVSSTPDGLKTISPAAFGDPDIVGAVHWRAGRVVPGGGAPIIE